MAALHEILAMVLPGGESIGAPVPQGDEAGRVGWVRVLRARVPALDVLEASDLVIVPASSLAVVAPARADLVDLAQTLARSGASGLLLVPAAASTGTDAPGHDDAIAALGAAAADAGLPAIRIQGMDPATLEKRVIGFLVDRRGELERQSSVLEGDLAQLAMAGRGAESLIAAIGGFLRRAVALEGRRSDTIALHAPSDVPDAAAAVAGYLARPLSGGRRVPLPGAPGENAPAGWLVLLGDRPISDLETVATERVAPLLSLELLVESQVRRARDESARGEALPSDGPPWVVMVARQPESIPGQPSREEIREELRFRFAARRLSLRGTSESLDLRAIAALEQADPLGLRIASGMAEFLGRTVALSQPFTEPNGRPTEEANARATLDAAERLTEPPLVARADRLAAYRLLASLGSLPDDRMQATALLEPLLDGRPAGVRERLATLRAVLDHGAAGEAASRLGIHRNTLAYRVRNLEARTGWDLGDPELRLALSVAVRVVQSAQ
ncbi:MAG TPA: helix-turn-helix domain-containing protein [Candidatus Limnocylindrales bacterium]|nr:helix-turn-helix domain-containing protein [Candidatus Limnocylindrales bacterium]